jgi:hypothetical protein
MVIRMWKERFLVAGGVAVLLGACAPRGARGREVTPAEARDESANAELGVVRALVAAFNQHEPERMAALVHEDFEYLSVEGSNTWPSASGSPGRGSPAAARKRPSESTRSATGS